jgi:molybdopterin synthase catalytic subunit
MTIEYLIKGPISVELISRVIAKTGLMTDAGGHSVFIGQVRADETNGKMVRAIEYSAYDSMVRDEADKIKEAVFSEFQDVKGINIIHSTGIVKAGEISLLVVVSAGHRQQAIAANSKTVELIKEKLPVWKKEIFEDNSHEWKQNHPS